jgi:hypothetical protein
MEVSLEMSETVQTEKTSRSLKRAKDCIITWVREWKTNMSDLLYG